MTAITQFHYSLSPRVRWKAQYHLLRAKRHDVRFRAKVWQMMAAGLLIFWALVAWGIQAVT
jgi:FtsH-binding integral membrane protein